ncbi:MAG: ISAzo13 family transposase, partial [Deltaproteobacteria bacterium]|nr:ISAzo13 family transposase [Deltaproteobacteria bacterium]
KTKKGLKIQTSVDTNEYAKGIKITDKEMKTLALEREEFHGEWNYTLHPRQNDHVIL